MLTCVVPDLNSCSQVLWLEDVAAHEPRLAAALNSVLRRRAAHVLMIRRANAPAFVRAVR